MCTYQPLFCQAISANPSRWRYRPIPAADRNNTEKRTARGWAHMRGPTTPRAGEIRAEDTHMLGLLQPHRSLTITSLLSCLCAPLIGRSHTLWIVYVLDISFLCMSKNKET